jgi:hypothetical protein
MKDWLKYVAIPLLFLGVVTLAFFWGRQSTKRLTYFSELTQRTQGRQAYIIDMEVVCSNGKDVGKLQVDLNLTNGKLVIVRNDSKLEPNCVR